MGREDDHPEGEEVRRGPAGTGGCVGGQPGGPQATNHTTTAGCGYQEGGRHWGQADRGALAETQKR